MDDLVGCCMAWVSALTPVAAEAVCGEVVHCDSTVTALMRTAKRRAKSEAHSDTGSLVIHTKSQGRNREGVQLCTGFLPTGG